MSSRVRSYRCLAKTVFTPLANLSIGAVVLAAGIGIWAGQAAASDALGASSPDWTGFYAGLHAGYAWGDVSVLDTTGGVPPGPFPYSAAGVFGGGTAGYNLQSGSFVAGIEADIGYMNLTGAGIIPSSTVPFHQDATLSGGVYGDVTGRFGYSLGQTLLYGKGGFAFYNGEARQTTTKPGYVTTGTGTFTGWALGVGVEHYVTPNMSLKVEYMHFDFGTQLGNQTSVGGPPIGFVYENLTTLTADSVKIGLNWHLN